FLLPSIDSEEFGPPGWYNPVIDCIVLQVQNDEVWEHEAAHRVFSIFANDFILLRALAGISHSLLSALVDLISTKPIRLMGKTLVTLQSTPSKLHDDTIDTIISRITFVEKFF